MDKKLPLWLFLLCLLLGGLATVLFGWVVNDTATGRRGFGRIGEAAVWVASFPRTVKSTFREIAEDPDEYLRVPRTAADLSDFQPVKTRSGINIQGMVMRADQAALAQSPGWRVLVGAFMMDGKVNHAALALSPELEVVKVWNLTEDQLPGKESMPWMRKLVHGLALLQDGSVVFTFEVGASLQRFDRCGRKLWSIPGEFHHSVTVDEREEFVWVPRGNEVVQVAVATGEVIRQISMENIIAANPELDILQVRGHDRNAVNENPRNTPITWLEDPFHLNDVEPLPAAIADKFPGFHAGDLLLSARSLNLVFVMDPETLAVKWWRSGAFRRQHDPDWQASGAITVYDNRMGRDYSRILSMVPASQSANVVFDGRASDFYSYLRGKHQVTGTGNLLLTSPQQGRVFEVDPNGKIVLEVFNTKAGTDEFSYPMSQASWFPAGDFDFERDFSCAN